MTLDASYVRPFEHLLEEYSLVFEGINWLGAHLKVTLRVHFRMLNLVFGANEDKLDGS